MKDQPTQKLLHYTIIFNAFVFLNIFNLINARKLEPDEWNVFENFCNNQLFFIILVTSLVVQVLMVDIGGKVIQTVPLSPTANAVCVGLGLSELLIGVLIKYLPLSWFEPNLKPKPLRAVSPFV